jgi:putative hydrolase of the HAD superfamily
MSPPAAIQGVTFDVGGTLIEPWPSVGHVYAEVAARHGRRNLSVELLNERFAAAWRACVDFDYSRAGWERLVNATFRGLNDAVERVDFFPDLFERFAEPDAWRVFEDVRPALETLASRGLRLGVISNWDDRLRVLLRRLRLHDYFETLAISCEVGFTKPSPVIFEHAAAKLGLPPAAILHVGDSDELDVRGARAAGFRAARIERGGGAPGAIGVRSLAGLATKIAEQ